MTTINQNEFFYFVETKKSNETVAFFMLSIT